jgi:hypothetical protein
VGERFHHTPSSCAAREKYLRLSPIALSGKIINPTVHSYTHVCQHTLQLAYYTQLHNIESVNNSTPDDSFVATFRANTDLKHIQHCFDYIRQALICAAGTNLEMRNATTGRTNGWGVERLCRNYDGVVKWAEKWRNNQEDTILSGENKYSHDGRTM